MADNAKLMRPGILLACCAIISLSDAHGLYSQDPKSDIIQTMLARSEAVFSGRYRYTEYATGNEKTGLKKPLTFELAFFGASWKLLHKAAISDLMAQGRESDPTRGSPPEGEVERIQLCHKGMYFDYKSVPQLDKTIRRAARVTLASDEKPFEDQVRTPFAGEFWFKATQEFVRANATAARWKGRTEVSGVAVDEYDWEVSEQQADDAFRGVSAITEKGGTLRIFVARQLGYVIPRIEHVGVSGAVGTRLDASDFVEVDGFFIPRKAKRQNYDIKGKVVYFEEYEVLNVKDLNRAIDEREFAIEMPVGTEVTDSRYGTGSNIFVVEKDNSPLSSYEGALIPRQNHWASWIRGWEGAVAIGLCLGALIVAIVICVRWRARRG